MCFSATCRTTAVCAGLEQLVQYIQNLHFDEEDIAFLRDKHLFSEDFLSYLRDFRFTGDIWAVPEGTPIFPREPVVTVRAPAIQAQLIETFTLLTINHQSLIATKANRIVRAAQGRTVLEFGSRRAQGTDGAISGARAAYIGGCAGTACTISDQLYGVPAGGTMAHSWVQMFDSQYEAFKTYCQIYPHNATLLDAGWTECKISVSNSLDEYIIQDLLLQGAKIDVFGVGERMITARSEPVFGGVYKLAAVEDGDGKIIPKIKVSENLDKITIPHFKKTYRIFDNATGKAEADYITVWDETVDESAPLELFDPRATWKRKTYTNFTAKPLQVPVFQGGELVYQLPALPEIQAYCRAQVDTLWDTVKRFENPHTYYVDLSQKLFDIKQDLLCRSR